MPSFLASALPFSKASWNTARAYHKCQDKVCFSWLIFPNPAQSVVVSCSALHVPETSCGWRSLFRGVEWSQWTSDVNKNTGLRPFAANCCICSPPSPTHPNRPRFNHTLQNRETVHNVLVIWPRSLKVEAPWSDGLLGVNTKVEKHHLGVNKEVEKHRLGVNKKVEKHHLSVNKEVEKHHLGVNKEVEKHRLGISEVSLQPPNLGINYMYTTSKHGAWY